MGDLFDFLGCMFSSKSPRHPKRAPAAKLLLPGDGGSSLASVTPHGAQPFYARYPMTRAPTVRESVPPVLPDYPRRAASPHTYWRARHASPAYERYSECYAPPLPYSYCVPPENCYAREELEEEEDPYWAFQSYPSQFPAARARVSRGAARFPEYRQAVPPAYAHHTYAQHTYAPPSALRPREAVMSHTGMSFDHVQSTSELQTPAAHASPHYPHTGSHPHTGLHPHTAAGPHTVAAPQQYPVSQQYVCPPEVCQMPPVGVPAHSARSAERVPVAQVSVPVAQPHSVVECVQAPDHPSPGTGVACQTPVCNEANKDVMSGGVVPGAPLAHGSEDDCYASATEEKETAELKAVDLERGPMTTMAETSDDAGMSDSWGVGGANDLAVLQHCPEVLGQGSCCPVDIAPPTKPSEKCARSPLEEKKEKPELPQFQPLSSPSAGLAASSASPVSSSETAAGALAEAGTDPQDGGMVSWESCPSSAEGPSSSDAEKRPPETETQSSGASGTASLVRRRVEEWNRRLEAEQAAAASPLPAASVKRWKVKRTRKQSSEEMERCVPPEERASDSFDDSAAPSLLREPAAEHESGAVVGLPAVDLRRLEAEYVSQRHLETETRLSLETRLETETRLALETRLETETRLALETRLETPPPEAETDDVVVCGAADDWTTLLRAAPMSQTQSPSPTQLPRNPFGAVYAPPEVSPSLVSRRVPKFTDNCRTTWPLTDLSLVPSEQSSTEMMRLRTLELSRQLTAHIARDDLHKDLEEYLRLQRVTDYEFVRLKPKLYAVCRLTNLKSPSNKEWEMDHSVTESGSAVSQSLYIGKAQQFAAQLPPNVFCYVQVSLVLGRLSVAVLPRSAVISHFGAAAVHKWLTSDNRYFYQQRPANTDRRRRSASCTIGNPARTARTKLPEGGAPWRRGQPEPIAAFLDFCRRVNNPGSAGNTDPCPSRLPQELRSFTQELQTRQRHKRRASSQL